MCIRDRFWGELACPRLSPAPETTRNQMQYPPFSGQFVPGLRPLHLFPLCSSHYDQRTSPLVATPR
eukprot:3463104-Rhodomonas_salina.1